MQSRKLSIKDFICSEKAEKREIGFMKNLGTRRGNIYANSYNLYR